MNDKTANRKKESKNSRKRSAVLALVIVLLFAALLVLSGTLIRVDEITVTGNRFYDAEEIRYRIFPEEEPRLYTVLKEKYLMPASKRALFKSCRLKMPDLHTVSIEIEELEGFAQVEEPSGSFLRLDENRRILASSTREDLTLPVIRGITIEEPALFDIAEDEQLQDAMLYLSALKETDLPFKALEYSEEKGFFIQAGNVVIRYGSVDNAEEKVGLSKDQYPEIAPLSGTLHLEKYTQDHPDSTIYFKVGEE